MIVMGSWVSQGYLELSGALGASGDKGDLGDRESGECVAALDVGLRNPLVMVFFCNCCLPGRRSTADPGLAAVREAGFVRCAVSSFKWYLDQEMTRKPY